MPSVLIATPCYGGQMTVGYYRGLELIRNALEAHDIDYDLLITEGESNVNRARNGMVATFLNQTNFDVLAFIDADIEFIDGDDFVRLLTEKEGIRGAMIAMKTPDHSEALSAWKDGKRIERNRILDTHISVDFLGSAVLLVDREVLEALSSEHTFLSVSDPVLGDYPALFECSISDGVYLSEDYGFCELARAAGFSIWADTRVKCRHWGNSSWIF